MRSFRWPLYLLLAGALLTGSAAQAQRVLESSAVSGAGGRSSAGPYTLTSTVGQPSPAGRARTGALLLFSGYPAPVFAANDVLAITHRPPSPQPAGQPVSITADISGEGEAEMQEATLYYRQGGDERYSTRTLSPEDDDYAATIPAEAMTSEGVAYYLSATDQQGRTVRTPLVEAYSVRVNVPAPGVVKDESLPGGTEQSAYRLLSVPLDLNEKDPAAVLADDLGDYDPAEWRFFDLQNDLVEFPNTRPMAPGRGFWLIVRDGADNLDTGAGTTLKLNRPDSVALPPGWSLVGNPFDFPIPIENVTLDGGARVQLRAYNNGWNDPINAPVTEMQPFQGYAVYNDTPNEETLLIDPDIAEPEPVTGKRVQAQAPPEPSWSVRIVARSQAARDADNVAAVMPGAASGQDAQDWPEPPVIGAYVSVAFPHPEWNSRNPLYSTDVRPEPTRGAIWTFKVQTNIPQHPVQLAFDGVQDVPEDLQVWLVDEQLAISRDMRAAPRYEVANPTSGSARSFKLIVGKRDFVQAQLGETGTRPATYTLDKPFPNPARASVTIRYGLPDDERVTMRVYNVLGEEVRTLLRGEQKAAGRHATVWDGTGAMGQRVASGVYVVRLQAGGFSATRKMVLVK